MFLKRIIKDSLAFLIYYLPKNHRASILMYHSISNNNVFFTVRPKIFARQMQFLKEKGYIVISLSELVGILSSNKPLLKKTVVLTFDDGYEDNYYNVLSILEKYGFPATIFISPRLVGCYLKNSQESALKVLDWQDMYKMSQTGFIDFQPHGLTHQKLDKLCINELQHEIKKSKKILEKRLKKICWFFTYPHGRYNKRTIQVLNENNFKAALTVNKGFVKKGDNLYALNRNSINSTVSFIQFKAKL
ncbi:polysaccharide deacetylase family protein [Patescibacteria group bacterium]